MIQYKESSERSQDSRDDGQGGLYGDLQSDIIEIDPDGKNDFRKASAEFRQHLPDLSSPRFTTAAKQDAYGYADTFKTQQNPPWLYELALVWQQLYEEPFRGVTNDGNVRSGLFQVQDEGVPIERICEAVKQVLHQITPEQKSKLQYPINAPEWRAWSNPSLLLRPFGLRLEEVAPEVATSILSVLEASFSRKGYQKALAAMRINHFLGEICHLGKILNKYSYNFLVFGQPSMTEPWGWSLYGHHLCLNVFLKGSQIVISPTFTGAEPNVIDTGEFAGTQILLEEGNLGLQLMQSLPDTAKETAQTYELLHDPRMMQTGDLITDRWNQDDQRHLCGAFRDNRTVAYEGVKVSELDPDQQQLILDISEHFLLYLPESARRMRKAQIQSHFNETYFSWIGAYSDDAAFYYRIQSPVIMIEFDHHSGVFLANQEPARFHTHTIVRTPNAGDYGNALRKLEEKM